MKELPEEYAFCPIRHVVNQFGDKWSMLILYVLDTKGTLRFSEIQKEMVDISQKMLSSTLKRLEINHLIHREVYPVVPPRVEYSLTEVGQSLMPHITSLTTWANEHFGIFQHVE
ncbi:helix-turn-helix domain-containing protein [uncultured Bacteroides sp.]|uniref:winged helix-turn-helix transcriptional regulator n=1 Tax=uncultured Bacteroides sp. TaxID=162156 RepID=UPI002AAB25AB|nr:helix-turn-helix domain-containing protein [uncultured Bacteroides sp.]